MNFKKLQARLRKDTLLQDERGLSTVEYVILLVLIAASCITLWMSLGESISKRISGSTALIEQHVNVPEGDDDTE